MPLRTPDRRYIVVRGRLWRAARPDLAPDERERLVRELMAARRDVGRARRTGDAELLADARRRVQATKEGLGERGAPWWTDGEPDWNRHLAKNTPYARWWSVASAIVTLLEARDGTICPSEAARALDPERWRERMDEVRAVAATLADDRVLVVTQGGVAVEPRHTTGPIRLGRGPAFT